MAPNNIIGMISVSIKIGFYPMTSKLSNLFRISLIPKQIQSKGDHRLNSKAIRYIARSPNWKEKEANSAAIVLRGPHPLI